MRLDRIDLNLFVVFEAIYRERSVTKASQSLNLTQPAISNALSRLRDTFNDQLFIRSPQGMLPTTLADNVIGDVRTALQLLGKTVGASQQFDPKLSEKTFKLGMTKLAEYLTLPLLMENILEEAPGASLTSFYVDRKKATEDLKSGALDLLLDAASYHVDDLRQLPLGELDYVVATRAENPVLTQDFSLNDYLSAEHIHVSSRRGGKGQMDIALQALGHKRNIKLRVQNYHVASQIALQTNLLWTAPRIFVEAKGLSYRPVPFAIPPMPLNLYWHKSTTDEPANKWIRDKILAAIKKAIN